jgi:hypothetical protein
MKKMMFVCSLLLAALTNLPAQQKPVTKFMQITTIESVVGGGLGRSRLIVTKEDGTQDEMDMENLFSLTGLNLKNIKNNESLILKTLKSYTDAGWKLVSALPLTLSPGQGGNGIFMTRYLLSKEAD